MNSSEQSAGSGVRRPALAGSAPANLLGDFSALLRQIGSVECIGLDAVPLEGASPTDLIQRYLKDILLPVELPAIAEACGHALRLEHRELVEQDQRLTAKLDLTPWASASRRAGRLQLARLRPLRNERLLRRYGAAVESGSAEGWHTVVYGVTMALYSLPLRQGLLHYAQETLSTFARNVVRLDNIPDYLDALLEQTPAAVEAALGRC
jgi:hypothetical protein